MRRLLPVFLLVAACAGEVPPVEEGAPDSAAEPPAAGSADPRGTAGTLPPRGAVVEFTRSTEHHTATARLHEQSGLLNLRVTPIDAEDAEFGMADRLELLRPLVDSALRADEGRTTRDVTVGLYPELAPRLAAAALCDDAWDPAAGRHREGDAATEVTRLLQDAALFAELAAFFAGFGYEVGVRSAESVLVCDARELDTATMHTICPLRPAPAARLPCGAQLLFRIDLTGTRR